MVCCILLNLTKRQQVDLIREELFNTYPTEYHMIEADEESLSTLLQPLGLYRKRAQTLKKFSWDYINGFNDIQECYGVGQYGKDSWNIFQLNKHTNHSNDKVLHKYLKEIQWNLKDNKLNSMEPRRSINCLQKRNSSWYL